MNIFRSADILLPADGNFETWAVIACDQFTSDEAYWQRVRKAAEGVPSTIHMIIPEAELEGDQTAAVERINAQMEQYLHMGVFQTCPGSYIYVERTLENGSIRPGLVGMVDLEAYDYTPGSGSLIRATEKTVAERIPPRMLVRRNAPVELPHVLMLCDDDQRMLIEPLAAKKAALPKVYDFDLMEGGGHITGWLVSGEDAAEFDRRFAEYTLHYEEKYPDLPQPKVLLAVGDGNHSLATAKSCYEERKQASSGSDLSSHPARYALVELENIHDASQVFEPIHRIVLETDPEKLLADLRAVCAPGGCPVRCQMGSRVETLTLDGAPGELAVAVLQNFLDRWLAENPGRIDYIHGDDEVARLAEQPNAVGFLLPAMEKHQLFRGVIAGGVLPRKTFSMGHAREKRYYLEGRRIR